MKKCILKVSLSAFVVTLIGVILIFVGDPSIFAASINNLVGLFPALWYLIIIPGVGFLLWLLDIILKIRRRDRSFLLPFALFVSILALLVSGPAAYVELIGGKVPNSLTFTSGAALIVLSYLVLVVLTFIDLFQKGAPRVKKEELEAEVYETVEENEDGELAPVEYMEEEVEDDEDLEEESEEEVRAEEKKKKGAKKEKDEKEHDRIYHIMKRAKDDRWIVKIAQSKKAIKIFDTQKEAIAYAEVLASNNNGVVRVFASKGANKGRIII